MWDSVLYSELVLHKQIFLALSAYRNKQNAINSHSSGTKEIKTHCNVREIYSFGKRENREFHACTFRPNMRRNDCGHIHFPNIYRKAISVLQNVKKIILFPSLV
jgi:hypothetical protein